VRLPLGPGASYTRSKAVPVDARLDSVYPAERHTIRGAGFWCNSLDETRTFADWRGMPGQPAARYTEAFQLLVMNGKFPVI